MHYKKLNCVMEEMDQLSKGFFKFQLGVNCNSGK